MSFSPNVLSQRDPRWIDEKLGFDDTVTIGTDGAALTCLAMFANGFGFTETPSSLNRKLKDLGSGVGFLGALIVWPGLTSAFPGILFQRIIVCRDAPAPLAEINASLEAGQPLLVEIDRSPSPGLQNHWVLIYDRQENDYLMLDPFSKPSDVLPVELISRYGLDRDAAEFITTVVWYAALAGPSPAPPSEQVASQPSQDDLTAPMTTTQPASPSADSYSLPASMVPEPLSGPLALAGTASAAAPQTDTAPAEAYSPPASMVPGPLTGTPPTNLATLATAPQPTPAPDARPVPTSAAETAALTQIKPAPVSASTIATAPVGSTPPMPDALPAAAPDLSTDIRSVFVQESVGSVGLRLRDQPLPNANTVAILSAGAELSLLEPLDQALAKVGQKDQWLNVRTLGDVSGYVLAWFIETRPGASTVPLTQPTATPEMLKVVVSAQASGGLRLRDRPDTKGRILTLLKPGTPLSVLEAPGPARSKIGQGSQWLNVREPGGKSGYVMAAYITG